MPDVADAYFVPRPRRGHEGPRTPAGRIVRLLGGVAAAAQDAGRDVKSVYRWLATTEDGGTGGRVPPAAQDLIIAAAAKRGIVLAHADFTPKPGEAYS